MSVYKSRAIDGFDGYLVTDCGRVLSVASGRFLTPRSVNGYHMVTLGGRGGRQISIHVLVASAFISARPPGMVVNHKNGIRTDNALSNLEWVTQSENVTHAYRQGLRCIDSPHRERAAALGRARRSFTEDQAATVLMTYSGARGQITALAKQHNLSRHAIASIVGVSK
jgi:hypothetical protein